MSLVIGIDPGITGALVALHDTRPITWLPMPTVKAGKATRVNGAALAAYIRTITSQQERSIPGALVAVVEDVHAMPRQGVTSMFSFGHAAGVVAGVLAAVGIPTTYVTPQAWKRRAGILPGSDKDAARSVAARTWPDWRDLDTKARGQALADAALIALHGGHR